MAEISPSRRQEEEEKRVKMLDPQQKKFTSSWREWKSAFSNLGTTCKKVESKSKT